jgi:hypothetical protein
VGAAGTLWAAGRNGNKPTIKLTNEIETPSQRRRAQQQFAFFSDDCDCIDGFLDETKWNRGLSPPRVGSLMDAHGRQQGS